MFENGAFNAKKALGKIIDLIRAAFTRGLEPSDSLGRLVLETAAKSMINFSINKRSFYYSKLVRR